LISEGNRNSAVRLEAGLGLEQPGVAPRTILNRAAKSAALLLDEELTRTSLAHAASLRAASQQTVWSENFHWRRVAL